MFGIRRPIFFRCISEILISSERKCRHPIFLNRASRSLSSEGNIPIFSSEIDSYNGATVNENLSKITVDEFRVRLKCSLDVWRNQNRLGVWLRIPISRSALIPEAVSLGFWFHHCSPDFILLCTWLSGGRDKSKLPGAPHHYVGVAGFVMNSHDEVLVIQESSGPSSKTGMWKLPGGLCDLREDISAATVREVKEETGIDCEYTKLAAIIEGHHGRGPSRESASDLYCISVLRCVDDSQKLVPQESEIAICSWLPFIEILNHPFYADSTAFGTGLRSAHFVATYGRNDVTADVTASKIHSNTMVSNRTSEGPLGLCANSYPVGFAGKTANVYHVPFKK
jgi:8-oxo-dGTP pyrophosphatase MutT (NUDIX family)